MTNENPHLTIRVEKVDGEFKLHVDHSGFSHGELATAAAQLITEAERLFAEFRKLRDAAN